MKLISNVEFKADEVVISRKIFYVLDKKKQVYVLDAKRSKESVVADEEVAQKVMSSEDMADLIREFVGNKRWKIVLSVGTANIFRRSKAIKPQKK
jgi:Ethanolamine utilization protein EutJ (predicted chaperonin)